jgi:hypothetical protein
MNNNIPNYQPYSYPNMNPNFIPYQPFPYNPSVNFAQPPQTKNIMYGGSTILRNGSSSYRPLPVP